MRTVVRMLIVSLMGTATSLQAITYIVPNDRDLVMDAEAIVLAKGICSYSTLTADGRLVTIAELDVKQSLKGSFHKGDTLRLTELGGSLTNIALLIPGAPRYELGVEYMVFVATNQHGESITYGMGLGRFQFMTDLHGRAILSRGIDGEPIFGFGANGTPHKELERDANRFIAFVEHIVANENTAADYYLKESELRRYVPVDESHTPRPLAGSSRGDYLSAGNARWPSPSQQWFSYQTQTGYANGGVSALQTALSQWTGAGAGISYTYGGTTTNHTGLSGPRDFTNSVLFNDPNGLVASQRTQSNNPNIAAIGGAWVSNATYALGNETFETTVEGDVEVGSTISGVGEIQFAMVLTHELGHTLGFRHSDQTAANDPNVPCGPPLPCAPIGQAVMASIIPQSISGLQQYDLDAAQTVYGAGPVCNAPGITTQPASQSITSGNQASLSVVASGTPTLTYQWYVGTSPSTTTPVNGATSSTFNPSPTTTTSYWVRVSNSCNGVQFVNSNTAIVTVTCAPPTAATPVASPSSIAFGGSSTISETPTGSSPFTYQWYIGNSGTTTSPIGGATNSSVTVSPTTTTSYWVRVGGACAPTSDSPATTVTVAACVPPSAPAPIASPSTIPTGQSSTLSVSPTGTSPFTYQWYIGSQGDTSNPIGGAINSSVSVSPTVTTNYWVKVTGQCAPPSNSPATTVTVTCAPISGSPSASPNPINPGQSSTLTVFTNGAGPFTYQWYNGNIFDTSNPIAGATAASTIVSPTTTSSYWVRVTAGCGSQAAAVLVNVNGVCNAPAITTQPVSSTVAPSTPVTLSVSASGTAPFTYQWYIGDKGDVSNPIVGATAFSTVQSPAATTKYWVRVSNSCNGTQSADSNTATITVTSCVSPSITTQPANVSVPIGTAATLKVVAAGSALHYAWFQGAKGDTSKPTGAGDSATFVSGAISGNTKFWVRVSNSCNGTQTVDSNAAIVTATAPPRGRAVRH